MDELARQSPGSSEAATALSAGVVWPHGLQEQQTVKTSEAKEFRRLAEAEPLEVTCPTLCSSRVT